MSKERKATIARTIKGRFGSWRKGTRVVARWSSEFRSYTIERKCRRYPTMLLMTTMVGVPRRCLNFDK